MLARIFCTVVLLWDIWRPSIEMLHSSLVPCYMLLKPVFEALTWSYCHQKAQSKFQSFHPICQPTRGCPVALSDSNPVSPVTCYTHTWWHAPECRQRSNALGPDGKWFVLGSVTPSHGQTRSRIAAISEISEQVSVYVITNKHPWLNAYMPFCEGQEEKLPPR